MTYQVISVTPAAPVTAGSVDPNAVQLFKREPLELEPEMTYFQFISSGGQAGGPFFVRNDNIPDNVFSGWDYNFDQGLPTVGEEFENVTQFALSAKQALSSRIGLHLGASTVHFSQSNTDPSLDRTFIADVYLSNLTLDFYQDASFTYERYATVGEYYPVDGGTDTGSNSYNVEDDGTLTLVPAASNPSYGIDYPTAMGLLGGINTIYPLYLVAISGYLQRKFTDITDASDFADGIAYASATGFKIYNPQFLFQQTSDNPDPTPGPIKPSKPNAPSPAPFSGTVMEIPLTPKAQRFRTTIVGVAYQFAVRWNSAAACWILDIFDVDGDPLVNSLPMICGADLLGQHKHLGFAFALLVQTDHDSDTQPTFENLGITSRLYVVMP